MNGKKCVCLFRKRSPTRAWVNSHELLSAFGSQWYTGCMRVIIRTAVGHTCNCNDNGGIALAIMMIAERGALCLLETLLSLSNRRAIHCGYNVQWPFTYLNRKGAQMPSVTHRGRYDLLYLYYYLLFGDRVKPATRSWDRSTSGFMKNTTRNCSKWVNTLSFSSNFVCSVLSLALLCPHYYTTPQLPTADGNDKPMLCWWRSTVMGPFGIFGQRIFERKREMPFFERLQLNRVQSQDYFGSYSLIVCPQDRIIVVGPGKYTALLHNCGLPTASHSWVTLNYYYCSSM